jgi:hypothetical protein
MARAAKSAVVKSVGNILFAIKTENGRYKGRRRRKHAA